MRQWEYVVMGVTSSSARRIDADSVEVTSSGALVLSRNNKAVTVLAPTEWTSAQRVDKSQETA